MAEALKNGEHDGSIFGDLKQWTTWIEEDGVTIIKSPAVLFSMPPSYEYMIQETNKSFYSRHTNAKDAYAEWKKRQESGYVRGVNSGFGGFGGTESCEFKGCGTTCEKHKSNKNE